MFGHVDTFIRVVYLNGSILIAVGEWDGPALHMLLGGVFTHTCRVGLPARCVVSVFF